MLVFRFWGALTCWGWFCGVPFCHRWVCKCLLTQNAGPFSCRVFFPHMFLYHLAFASSTRPWLHLLIAFSCDRMSASCSGLRLFLSWRRWHNWFFSWIAGARMCLLATYQPLHLRSMATAVSLPVRTTASQKLLYSILHEVNWRRYLLYCLVWATLKTIASSNILDLWNFLTYCFATKPPSYFGTNRKLMKRPF